MPGTEQADDIERFAALLWQLKQRSGLSYEVLAKQLHTSASTLHRHCRGAAVPDRFTPVERLARICRATTAELLELHRRWILADAAHRRATATGIPAAAGRGSATDPAVAPLVDGRSSVGGAARESLVDDRVTAVSAASDHTAPDTTAPEDITADTTAPEDTSADITAPGGTAPDDTAPARLPAAPHRIRPAQLPPGQAAFIGRVEELRCIDDLLPDDGTRPSTVVISAIGGMAGVGKTTLAVHWAQQAAARFPDGQIFLNLRGFDPAAPAMTPEEAVRVLLDALEVPPQRIPAELDAQTALYRSVLAHRRVLVLLDNARDTDQVLPLLPAAPGCLAIVTSRDSLTGLVAGEGAHPLTLHPLTPAEGHTFLARRLGARRTSAQPDATAEIVRRCGRLPLALAVVAARAAAEPDYPLTAVVDELREGQDSLDAFDSGHRGTDLRAVFSWSSQALTPPAARLFALLGLHTGPDLSVPAAAALAGLAPRTTRALLTELTRLHLVTRHAPGRYALHDLLCVYARERLRIDIPAGEQQRALERLLTWYLHTADAAYAWFAPRRRRVPQEPVPPDCEPSAFATHDEALGWCETERPNLVAAVQQAATSGLPGIAWRLSAALWGFFYLRSHVNDWLDTCRIALAAARAAHDRTGEAWTHNDLASALTVTRQYDEAIEHHRWAMIQRRELGDAVGRVQSISNLGDTYLKAGRCNKAVEYLRRAQVCWGHLGDAWGEGIALANLGDAYQRLGRFDAAVEQLQRALTVLRVTGNRWVEGVTFDIFGTVQHRLGRPGEAIEHYRQALDAHRDVGNRWVEGETLSHLGEVLLAEGRTEEAGAELRRALEIFEGLGHPDTARLRTRVVGLAR
ncbi:tetratricopeptide repeat protein [Streptomyces sp. NPDC059785]|uniref:tetratricopeptide repeat protein n=1 Tax=unclassified Streptomyces TaxID=2593676 RepID=UPI0036682144